MFAKYQYPVVIPFIPSGVEVRELVLFNDYAESLTVDCCWLTRTKPSFVITGLVSKLVVNLVTRACTCTSVSCIVISHGP